MARVALLTPFAAPSTRGNAVTVTRVAEGLRQRGVDLGVWDLSAAPADTIGAAIEAERPELIHAFHAFRCGPLAVRVARRLEVPLVVTLTGTDANHDLFDPARAATVRRVLEAAAVVTAFHDTIVERVTGALPDLRARFRVVPQAVRFPEPVPFELETRWPLPRDRVLFVLPAGIRPVKAPRRPLGALAPLPRRDARVRLAYVGPVLHDEEASALAAALVSRPWAKYLGAVPHAQMPGLLAAADIVLNCSLSEGGMANSVLEAMSVGRPVLAADIPGNRALVEHGATGLLFDDDASFLAGAERLVGDPGLRARLGAAGRALVERRYPPSREIEGYLEVYRGLLPVTVP